MPGRRDGIPGRRKTGRKGFGAAGSHTLQAFIPRESKIENGLGRVAKGGWNGDLSRRYPSVEEEEEEYGEASDCEGERRVTVGDGGKISVDGRQAASKPYREGTLRPGRQAGRQDGKPSDSMRPRGLVRGWKSVIVLIDCGLSEADIDVVNEYTLERATPDSILGVASVTVSDHTLNIDVVAASAGCTTIPERNLNAALPRELFKTLFCSLCLFEERANLRLESDHAMGGSLKTKEVVTRLKIAVNAGISCWEERGANGESKSGRRGMGNVRDQNCGRSVAKTSVYLSRKCPTITMLSTNFPYSAQLLYAFRDFPFYRIPIKFPPNPPEAGDAIDEEFCDSTNAVNGAVLYATDANQRVEKSRYAD
ncbi:hypothetical protein WH47_00901 [Habropoda laboriosa]|uniref:Uncharacterized protein n=1 Tax=Habropoda laboriosa TaxID=597456 RepID=A0A0L7R732_9HYME|nr:hypothetical protein WH47_00901 [Habropoda laboriosa]